MRKDSLILNPLGIPPIHIGREPLLVGATLNKSGRQDKRRPPGPIVTLVSPQDCQ